MSARLDHAVGLLERSLVGTRQVLGRVRPVDLPRPTPCAAWDLAALLAHLDDSLAAHLEASRGLVAVVPVPVPAEADTTADTTAGPAASLRVRAGTLLGAWSEAAEQGLDEVAVAAPVGGPLRLPADLLVSTAALEVAVHGWDVARSLGAHGSPAGSLADSLADSLAQALLPVARRTSGAGREAGHLAAPLPPAPGAGPREVLLTMLGRAPDWTGRDVSLE